MAGCNVFLYVDPYGVKDLDMGLIESFADRRLGLNSVEMLINLNSFGFLRAGCLALKVKYEDDAALKDDDDDEFAESLGQAAGDRPVDLLDSIAGGDYWRPIIEDFRNRRINGYDAERTFSDMYRRRLGKAYRYVLSMPIRLAERKQPKYRMVHATNHPDGCVLMADDMMKRTQDLYIHLGGYCQGTLLPQDVEGEISDPTFVEQEMDALLSQRSGFVDAQELMADFYVEHGVICKPQIVRDAWQKMETEDAIEIKREPSHTEKCKPRRFYTYTTKQRFWIKAKRPVGRPLF